MTRIKTILTPLAALNLTVVMILAAIYHFPRGEMMNITFNFVLAVLSAFIACGRWKLVPLGDRSASSKS